MREILVADPCPACGHSLREDHAAQLHKITEELWVSCLPSCDCCDFKTDPERLIFLQYGSSRTRWTVAVVRGDAAIRVSDPDDLD